MFILQLSKLLSERIHNCCLKVEPEISFPIIFFSAIPPQEWLLLCVSPNTVSCLLASFCFSGSLRCCMKSRETFPGKLVSSSKNAWPESWIVFLSQNQTHWKLSETFILSTGDFFLFCFYFSCCVLSKLFSWFFSFCWPFLKGTIFWHTSTLSIVGIILWHRVGSLKNACFIFNCLFLFFSKCTSRAHSVPVTGCF